MFNFKFSGKKGSSEMWWIIAVAIIALIMVVFILVWVRGSGGKLFGSVNEQISSFSDCDNDGAADFVDKCPCDPNLQDTLKTGQTCGKICTGDKSIDCVKK